MTAMERDSENARQHHFLEFLEDGDEVEAERPDIDFDDPAPVSRRRSSRPRPFSGENDWHRGSRVVARRRFGFPH
jgi:hypothetical protein